MIGHIRENIGGEHQVGHDVEFDRCFLDREYEKVDFPPMDNRRVVGTIEISRMRY